MMKVSDFNLIKVINKKLLIFIFFLDTDRELNEKIAQHLKDFFAKVLKFFF